MTHRVLGRAVLIAALVTVALPNAGGAQLMTAAGETVELAQAGGTEPRELEPRYQPRPPEEPPSWYNTGYFFALTRGVAGSTMVPALKAPLFLFTVPLDIVLVPFAAIGGLFG